MTTDQRNDQRSDQRSIDSHRQWSHIQADEIDAGNERAPASPITALQLHIGWKTIVVIAAALFLGLGVLGAVWLLVRPLAFLVLGLAIVAALQPPVTWLSRWIPRLLAITVIHLAVIAVVIGLGALVIPPLVTQIQEVDESVPEALDWLDGRIESLGIQNVDPLVNNGLSLLRGVGGQLLALPMAVSDMLLDVLVVFFLSVYGLMALPSGREFIKSLAPETHHKDIQHVLSELVEAMGGYVRGVFITGISVGVVTYVGLSLIGVPYPILLSVLAGVLEVIPVVGTAISMVTITGVALTESVSTGLITFALMIAIQVVEGNILFPNIVGRQTHSSPLLSMFAFFAGMSVGGIIGGVIGVPLAAALRVLIVEVVAPAVRRWTHADTGEPNADENTA